MLSFLGSPALGACCCSSRSASSVRREASLACRGSCSNASESLKRYRICSATMLCLRFSATVRASRKCFLYRFRQYQACCLQRLTAHLHSGFQLTTVESDAAKSVHACPVKWRAPQLIAVRPQVQGLHEMNLGRFILALDAVDSAKCEVGASRVSYKSGTLSSLRNQGDLDREMTY